MFPSAIVPGLPRVVRSHQAGAWSAWCCGWKLARRLSCCLSAWGLSWFGETSHVFNEKTMKDFETQCWYCEGELNSISPTMFMAILECQVESAQGDAFKRWFRYIRIPSPTEWCEPGMWCFQHSILWCFPPKAKMLLKITCFHSRWGQDSTLNVCRPQDSLG